MHVAHNVTQSFIFSSSFVFSKRSHVLFFQLVRINGRYTRRGKHKLLLFASPLTSLAKHPFFFLLLVKRKKIPWYLYPSIKVNRVKALLSRLWEASMDQKILALTGDVFTSMILLLTISRPPCSIFMTSYFFLDLDLSGFILKPVQRLKWSYFKIYMRCMMSMVELERGAVPKKSTR